MPVYNKDLIKEILFDEFGHGNKTWCEKVDEPTFRVLNYIIEEQLKAGTSLVIETPPNIELDYSKLKHWQHQYKFRCVQVICYADPNVLLGRYLARINAPERHPGHNDEACLEDYKINLGKNGKTEPLDLHGITIEVNTTDFDTIDGPALIRQIKKFMKEA